MNIKIEPSSLSGDISAIPSKSHVHRALICAALSDRNTEINLHGTSSDIEATIRCLHSLGTEIEKLDDSTLSVTPIGTNISKTALLDCGESGSTLRFLLPVAAALGCNAMFTGSGRLPSRPLEPLLSQLQSHGVEISSSYLPLELGNQLKSGVFNLPGDVSSQYFTGLLLALPLVGGGEINLLTPLQSKSYVDMTISVMSNFGVHVVQTTGGYVVPASSYTSPLRVYSEGDWSNAAFWLCAGAISAPITVRGLDLKSTQGDKEVLDILKKFGAKLEISQNSITVSPGSLRGVQIDAGEVPDLIPVISIVASVAEGVTRIYNAKRLRLKESDRLSATAEILTKLGVEVYELEDELIIKGRKKLSGGSLPGYNDHRMVMSCAIASLVSASPIEISDSEAVEKSYPHFFEDFVSLGGVINV